MTVRFVASSTLVGLIALSIGCIHQVSGGPIQGVDMSRYRSFYVVQAAEHSDFASAIHGDLLGRGLTVGVGPEGSMSASTDCKVTFEDHWTWDGTMYPMEIDIKMIDSRNGALVASGRCMRSSLNRTEPAEMVQEVTDRIFAAATPTKE